MVLRSAPKCQISGQFAEFRDFQGNKEAGEEPGDAGLLRGFWIKY